MKSSEGGMEVNEELRVGMEVNEELREWNGGK